MTVLEILEAKYTKEDRTEYTVKFKPIGKKLNNVTKDDVVIASVSDGSKDDYEVVNFGYNKVSGGTITFKTSKDPISAEIMIKFNGNEEEYSVDTREKVAETTAETPTETAPAAPAPEATTETGSTTATTPETSKPGELIPPTAVPPSETAGTEEHNTSEETSFERKEEPTGEPAGETPVYPYENRFTNMLTQPKVFTPKSYGYYYKDQFDTYSAGKLSEYEAEVTLAYSTSGDFFMRAGSKFSVPIYEGTHRGDVFMVINNFTEAELREYLEIRVTGDYYKTYEFKVLKEHPEAVTKPLNLEISFIRLNDRKEITRFNIELSPVNPALKLPEVKNNKKVPGPVFTVKTSKNFYETLLNVFIEKNEDYFELVKWTAEGYSFNIPFRNPANIVYCSCYPHEAPNRAKRLIAFVQIRAKFPGEFTIVWTVRGKNGAIADIRQPIKVLGTPSPTDGMTPDEKEEFLIYGHTALERDMVFNYNSLSRKVRLYVDDSYVSKFNKPAWALDREYRFNGGINTDLLRLKEFFDKNPTLPVEVYSNSFYGKVTAANFVDFLNKYKSGEGIEYTMYDPPYYRTWLEREMKKKKEIDYIKMAQDMGW